MIHCPACNHKELSGALFCSQCGTQLIQVKDEDEPDIQNATVENTSSAVIPPFPTQLENTFESNVTLLIMEEDDLIPIEGEDVFTLGRFTQGQTILPDIDLSPYQAYESGVSRLHADILVDNIKSRSRH